jgi:hypothetical protein
VRIGDNKIEQSDFHWFVISLYDFFLPMIRVDGLAFIEVGLLLVGD